MLFNTSEAAATLTVGTDAFRNERKRTSSRPRMMTGIAIVGGNAINQATINLFIEDYFVGAFRNSRAGVAAPILPDDIQPTGRRAIPAGSQVSAPVAVAPTVSPLQVMVFGEEY